MSSNVVSQAYVDYVKEHWIVVGRDHFGKPLIFQEPGTNNTFNLEDWIVE